MAGAGLDAERPHAVIRAQIDLIGELRVEVEEIIALEQRIDAIEADRVAFETRVTAMAGLFEVQADTPDQALAMLAAAAQDAAAARTNRAQLAKQLSDAERRIARSVAAQAYAMARLAPLSRMAGSEDRAALAAAVQASDQARILRGELERLSVEILGAGAGPGLDALLAEVAEADGAALLVRGGDLADALSALSDDVARLTGERATTQAAFSRLDDGPDAAIAAADAEQARSEMAAQAEAYVRKRAEVALLRWTIARYRAQKQSPLLNRASALFSTLTLGRYVALLVDLEADKARLTGLRADGAVTPIEGMSEGTLDQLFLALRLAAVEDAVRGGAVLPFLADDLFINYDNARAEAGLRVLADLARTTQVLFFTHHAHLATIAERALAPLQVSRRLLA